MTSVLRLEITNAGAGYTEAPTITISGGGGQVLQQLVLFPQPLVYKMSLLVLLELDIHPLQHLL